MRALAEVSRMTGRQLARQKWQSSGIEDKTARALRLRAVRADRVHGRFYPVWALLIPYWDLKGRPTKFYRVRYLERLPGAAGAAESPRRYDQLPVLQEAYYPPLMNWQSIADDPDTMIYVTEGELKAACACQHGIPMLALGGVYSFMSQKRGVDLLPSLRQFEWRERTVRIVYDNDITRKVGVMQAQHALSQRLLSEGAKIEYVNLPPGPEKGVDDYIVKHGSEKFLDLEVQPFLEAQALWEMNQEVVLIKNDGVPIVVERATSVAMAPDVFSRVLYANRFYMQQVKKGSGKTERTFLEKHPLAPHWMEWEHRAQLASLGYEPGKPQIVDERTWNTWAGWGVKPRRGDVGPWHWLMDFLFMGDDRARKYFEQWCAYPIQHPGAKLYTACLLWSRIKRLGKSMSAIALSKIYGDNAVFIDSKQLKGNFNAWAKNRQLVIGEEITAGEARVDADWLKGTITNPTFTINSKFKAEYTIRNCINFLFLSNHPDALFLETGDKRYFVHEVLQNSPAGRRYYEEAHAWLHGVGPEHLMDYLLKLDLRGFNPREHAPETRGKLEMIRMGKTDCGLWVQQLQEDPTTALRPLGQRVAEGCDLLSPEQMYRAFDPEERGRGRTGIAGLGRQLAAAGFRQVNGGVPVMTGTGLRRLYAVRNTVKWDQSTRQEIREHYNSFFVPGVVK